MGKLSKIERFFSSSIRAGALTEKHLHLSNMPTPCNEWTPSFAFAIVFTNHQIFALSLAFTFIAWEIRAFVTQLALVSSRAVGSIISICQNSQFQAISKYCSVWFYSELWWKIYFCCVKTCCSCVSTWTWLGNGVKQTYRYIGISFPDMVSVLKIWDWKLPSPG